jgi:hypothetical protein
VEPISPKVELLKLPDPEIATTPLPPKFGALKFGWLKMLKISARNCRRKRSLSGMSLKIEKSSLLNPGPGTCVTPPRQEGLSPTVQAAGWVNWGSLC